MNKYLLQAAAQQGSVLNYSDEFNAYKLRVETDGGTIENPQTVDAVIKGLKTIYGDLSGHKLILNGSGGMAKRVSGAYKYASKWYDISTNNNDAVQATEANQPIIGGADSNSKTHVINPTAGVRFLSFTEITFINTDLWAVSFLCDLDTLLNSGLIGYSTGNNRILFLPQLYIINSVGTVYNYINPLNDIPGELNHVLIKSTGTGNIVLYVNGVLRQGTNSGNSSIKFSRILKSFTSDYSSGKFYSVFVRAGALDDAKILAEYNMLRAIYTEIETVKVASNDFNKQNLSLIRNTVGVEIADASVTGTWTTGTAGWCKHTSAIGSEGKLYNKAARDLIVNYPPYGFHVATEAELTEISLLGGTAIKTAFGLSVLPSSRNADGTFATWGETAKIWCADSDKALLLDATNSATIVASTANEGHCIRLVKNTSLPKMVTIGDSITEQEKWQTTVKLVKSLRYNSLETTTGVGGHAKMGRSGSRIIPLVQDSEGMRSGESIYMRANDVDFYSPNIILLFGGQNDITTDSANLGTIDDVAYSGNEVGSNPPTFFASYKGTIEKLMAQNPTARIICVTPLFGTDKTVAQKQVYVSAIIACANLYSLTYADLLNNVAINAGNSGTYLADGTHPNDAGGVLIGTYISGLI